MTDDILVIPLKLQCIAFIYAVLSGAVLLLLFSFFTALRKVIPHKKAFVFAEDIICSFAVFASSFYLCMHFCSGRLRWYIFVGEMLGWIISCLTVGNAYILLFKTVISIVYKIILILFWRWFYNHSLTNLKKNLVVVILMV